MKRKISMIMAVILVLGVLGFFSGISFAETKVNLNKAGTVTATYPANGDPNLILIKGNGKIEKLYWVKLADKLKLGREEVDYNLWDKEATIKFEKDVKFPDDSKYLLYTFKGDIIFPDDFDTSNVTKMNFMFSGIKTKDLNVSGWNTSNVTTMAYMFENAKVANFDISGWDTGKVTSMEGMFKEAKAANPDVGNWNTIKVTNMCSMFYDATSADPEVSNWDTSSVTDMSSMFSGATSAKPNVSNWDTSSVTNMKSMFSGATSANPDVSNWNTFRVTDMSYMFYGATSANPDVSNWNTYSVTNMKSMFSGATSANPDVSNWNTGNVTNMGGMFENATSANPNVSNWDTSSVTFMDWMFSGTTLADPDVSNWNTSNVTNMNSMFRGATSANPDVSNWKTGSVTDIQSMFQDTDSANPDVSNWDTSNVTDMYFIFENAKGLRVLDMENWDFNKMGGNTFSYKAVTLDYFAINNNHKGFNAPVFTKAYKLEEYDSSGKLIKETFYPDGNTQFAHPNKTSKYIAYVVSKLTVENGQGSEHYGNEQVAKITADKLPGKVFDKWVIVSGNPVIEDVNKESTNVTMPGEDATVKATYKNSSSPIPNPTPGGSSGSNTTPGGSSGTGKPEEKPKPVDPKKPVAEKDTIKISYIKGYPDGTFRPQGNLTRAEAAVMMARLLNQGDVTTGSKTTKFTDANSGWYSQGINYVVDKGLIQGYEDGTFKPNQEITRAEFAKMIAEYVEGNQKGKSNLKDIEKHWAKEAIEKVYGKEIVKGYPDGTFKPNQKITRAEAVTILNRTFGRYTNNNSIKDVNITKGHTFSDVKSSDWFYYEVFDAANTHSVITSGHWEKIF